MYVPKRAVDKGWEAEGAETDQNLGFQSSDVLLAKCFGFVFYEIFADFLEYRTLFELGFFFVAESCGLFVGWVPQILDNIFNV